MTNTHRLDGIDPALATDLGLDRMPFQQLDASVADLMRLDGKTALVTGAAGPSLGQAICNRLAALGARVAVTDIDSAAVERLTRSLTDRWGAEAIPITMDVMNWENVRESVSGLGSLDILVNNAGGMFGREGPFAERSKDDIDWTVGLNLIGPMYVTSAALELMLPAGSGRIINIASEGGKVGMPGAVIYNACKSGVIGFTRQLVHEVSSSGVSVVTVCPGVMIGPYVLEHLQGGASALAETIKSALSRVTIGRPCLPEEVANVVAFLASEAGAYVHGTEVSVGGGMSG